MRFVTFAGLVGAFVGLSVPPAGAQDPQPAKQVYHSGARSEDRMAADAPTRQPMTQVLVRVKLIEAARTKLERLGFDFAQIRDGRVSRYRSLADAAFADQQPSAVVAGSELRFGVVGKQDKLFSVLKALSKDDLVRVLAAPNLVTVSGRPSYFQVGAEVPFGIPGDGGSSQIEQKFAGTRMDISPTVLDGGRIRLEVRLRVSEVAPMPVPVFPGALPALRTWAVDTAVELEPGQTLIAGGLVQKRVVSHTVATAPVAGSKDEDGKAAQAKQVAEPEEFESLVLIAAETFDPKGPIVAAKPDALGDWADSGPAKK